MTIRSGRDKIRREIIISSAKIILKNNLDNNWRSHVVLSVQLILHWKWNARSLHDREPVKTRRHIHTRVHLFFAHFLLVPVCFSLFFSPTLFVFYSFESQLKCINFIDGFIWNALVNKLHKWHGQDDYDDVDVVNSDYHVYSCTHRHSNYNVLYRKIASIVIIIRTFLLLHFLEYLYSVCTRSIAMPCTALHCTALHCTPIEWQFCNLRTSICYYLDCKLQMINLTSELPVNACIHAPLESIAQHIKTDPLFTYAN